MTRLLIILCILATIGVILKIIGGDLDDTIDDSQNWKDKFLN